VLLKIQHCFVTCKVPKKLTPANAAKLRVHISQANKDAITLFTSADSARELFILAKRLDPTVQETDEAQRLKSVLGTTIMVECMTRDGLIKADRKLLNATLSAGFSESQMVRAGCVGLVVVRFTGSSYGGVHWLTVSVGGGLGHPLWFMLI
jgi:hypothetical protein